MKRSKKKYCMNQAENIPKSIFLGEVFPMIQIFARGVIHSYLKLFSIIIFTVFHTPHIYT